jgi:hypothetical protein
MDFQIKKYFMNLIICDKAQKHKSGGLGIQKLGFGLVCKVS